MRTLQQNEMQKVNKYTKVRYIAAETTDSTSILTLGIRGVIYKLYYKFNLALSGFNTKSIVHKARTENANFLQDGSAHTTVSCNTTIT
jgi:hypothetical protein